MSELSERVYTILVQEVGAVDDHSHRATFALWFDTEPDRADEYRFCGKLSLGGKLYRRFIPFDSSHFFRVSCYKEDETPARLEAIRRANERLKEVAR